MIRTIAIIGFLSLCIVFNSYAHDSDRIEQLEMEIQELNLRISNVESLLNTPSKAQEVVNSTEGWKFIVNWRKLTRDMDNSDVRKILGEPEHLDGGDIETWYYPNNGFVRFIDGNLNRWVEPR